jgi:outer membrane receptor protein involved in Fe transport
MNTFMKWMLLGGSATAIIAGATAAAYAQDNAIETVESTGSRINLAGFQSPTPVTVIGLDTIERNAQINIGDEIRNLPQVGGTATQSSNTANIAQANAGVDTLSLRNLGAQRNLVLFDHQRVAITGIQDGTVDLSTIPSMLVSRIDVVTGGASAAWGSDAVTGVINIVINKNFTGFKANAEYQNNLLVPVPRYHLEAAWGTDFLGGKAHFEAGGSWNISNTATFNGQNPHNIGRTNVYNPAYCAPGGVTYPGGGTTGGTCTSPTGAHALMYAFNAGNPTIVQGGVINGNTAGGPGSGLAATSSNTVNVAAGLQGLQGLMFAGPSATPTNFNYGTVYNTNTCYNGCSNNQYSAGNNAFGISSLPYHSSNIFTYTSYQLTPDIKLGIQLGQGKYSTHDKGTTLSSTGQTVYADNAYLAPTIAQRFVCNGAASAACYTTLSNGYNPYTNQNDTSAWISSAGPTNLTVAQRQAAPSQRIITGFDFTNNRLAPAQATGAVGQTQAKTSPSSDIWTMANVCSAIGEACGFYNRVFNRASFQLDGSLGDEWAWSGYGAWSGMRLRETAPNDPIKTRLNNALDAVRITSGNVGTSGLPIGSVQCRGLLTPSNLADPTSTTYFDLKGCQPVNAFGAGNVTQAAYAFVNPGVDPQSGFLDQVEVRTAQTAAGASLTGVLPWKLPAGDIGIATGAEYRLEQAGQYNANPIGARNVLVAGNWINYQAQYHVEEGFLEVNAPILKNMIVQTLNVDLAGRITNYSSSGLVETWKIGVDSQLNDDFRIRGFYSSDIRAPDVYDLYNPGGANQQQCANWVTGLATNQCSALPGGNPDLKPEQASTVNIGVVMTPSFLDGFTASLDWYDLRMHGAITTVGYDTIIARAKQGDTAYCGVIITDNGSNICNYPQAVGTTGVPLIVGVRTGAVNAARLTTAGFDANIDYRFDLLGGQASVGVNANYVYDWSRTLNGVDFQGAGATGGVYSGGPAFHTTISLNYRTGPWSLGLEIHSAGDAVRDPGTENQPTVTLAQVTYSKVHGADVGVLGSGQTGEGILPTNYAPWSGDIGGRVQYRWSDVITLYGAMDRIFPGNKTYRVGMRFKL